MPYPAQPLSRPATLLRVTAVRALVLATVALFATTLPVQAASVQQGTIRDAHGRVIQLKGVNWFGAETDTHAPHGLWARNWKDSLDQMQDLGVNALRIPLCPDTIRGAPTKGIDPTLNPDLVGLDSLGVLDALLSETDRRGMYVVLDHHRPDCSGQSELWYTAGYTEAQWIDDITSLATRFSRHPSVLGIDLKNEPKGAATWGTGDASTDWNLAAARVTQRVLAIAPQWLVFVEGIEKNPTCSSTDPHFWGENLEPLLCTPLQIPRNRLVLAPHTYGPDVHAQPYFSDPTFPANMPAIWDRNFGQFQKQGYAVILGEFGGKYGQGGDIKDRIWQDQLVDYLINRGIRSAFYWSWNPNSADTGGLLQDDWKTVWPDKLNLLKRLWSGGQAKPLPVPPSVPAPTDPVPTITTSPTPARPGAAAYELRKVSEWGEGYCAEVTVRNPGASPLAWSVDVPLEGRIKQDWNATIDSKGAIAHVRGANWNATLAPGQDAHFGFCADHSQVSPKATATRSGVSTGDGAGATAGTGASRFSVVQTVDSRWATGYCTRFRVTNDGSTSGAWRVPAPIDSGFRLDNAWNATLEAGMAEGVDFNRVIGLGQTAEFGFCARR